MSHLIRRFVYLIMGILGGIAVWPLMETLLVVQSRFATYLVFSIVSGAAFGLVMGAFFGAVDGIVAGNLRRILEGTVFGAVVGALGGALGFVLGQSLLLFFGAADAIHITVARTAGWAVLGAGVSLAEGTRRRSVRRAVVGLLGGFIGGTIGGIAVETIPLILPVSYARPVGLALYGLAVTGAYGLAERQITVGVLRLLNGRYKGKEFILNQRTIKIGAHRHADIYLPEYRNVVERHAQIKEDGGELIVYPLSETAQVARNDEQVETGGSGILKYGDVLQMGSAKLLFRPLVAVMGVLLCLGTGGLLSAQSVSDDVESIRAAEVDTSRLLVDQTVDLYLGITDRDGLTISGVTAADLVIEEAPENGDHNPVEILSVDEGAAAEEGITFFLLIDNSGSMYDQINGMPTDNPDATRMAAVREAVRSFLDRVDNPADRIAVATFNTNYALLTEATNSVRTIDILLDEIAQPEPDEAYTELYRGIAAAARDLSEADGRRVLLVLSDGENYPFAEHADRPHPEFGSEVVVRQDAIDEIRRYGIGVFGIDFTGSGDPGLAAIATDGGGTVYSARTGTDLGTVYRDIRQRILEEYRVRYRASILPTEYRRVRVRMAGRVSASSENPIVERRYFAGTIFGLPRDDFGPLFLIPFAVALLLAALLTQLRFRNDRTRPNVEIFDVAGKATQILDLTGEKTVIGGARDADITIAGLPDLKDNHATIVHDASRGTYTIVASGAISVNNRQTTRRKLEPGDVIELPGATVVFDLPQDQSEER